MVNGCQNGVNMSKIETAQWMMQLEMSWRGGIRGISGGVADHIKTLDDSYLREININEFLTVHHNSAFTKYELLVWLKDNLRYLQSTAQNLLSNQQTDSNYVFMYWNQGFDNAPEIIKAVRDQNRKILGHNYQIVLLNDENWRNYIDESWIPPKLDKLSKNSIPHWSDWLRTAVLLKNGGLWLDATAFTTKKILPLLSKLKENGQIFAQRSISEHQISNWLIYAPKSWNYVMALQLSALNLYLENHEKFMEYFHYHTIWFFLSQLDKQFSIQWNTNINLKSSEAFQLWQKRDEINENIILEKYLLKHSVHKLNGAANANDYEMFAVKNLIKLSKNKQRDL